MRIVQIIDSLKVGGAERMAVNIASYLSERQVDNILIASRQGGGLESQIEPKVRFEVLGKNSFFDLKAFRKLYSLVKTFKPEVVHAHSTSVFWAVGVKLLLGKKFKIVFHDHYGKAESLRHSDRFLLRWISSHINGVVVVNDLLRSWAHACMDVDNKNVIQLNNFPYLPHFQLTAPGSTSIEILHLANFRPQKDHITLLEALSILKSNCDFEWVISLVGLSESPEYTQLVEDKIKSLGLGSRVKFRGATSDILPFLKASSVGVLSSESEGLSVSLLEYGLAGLHVVATDVGQTRSVLPSDKLGFVVSPKNPEALAKALCRALENSIQGRNHLLKDHINLNFGPAQFYKQYSGFLATL